MTRKKGRKPLSNEWFIAKIISIHGNNKFGFDMCEYNGNRHDVTLLCHSCNEYFTTKAMFPLRGCGCSNCRRSITAKKKTSNTNEFIAKATKVHGGKYDYSESEYLRSNRKIKIICKDHGPFYMTPSNHLNGQSCKECGYWDSVLLTNPDSTAKVYHVRFKDGSGLTFDKVGITTKSINYRFHGIGKMGLSVDIVRMYEGRVIDCVDIEKDILSFLSATGNKYKVRTLKGTGVGGWTECFHINEDIDLKIKTVFECGKINTKQI